MSSRFAALLALAAAVPAFAAVSITSPIESTTCKGGSACKISWEDNGESPELSSYGKCSIGIYVGNQWQQTMVQYFGDYDPSTTSSISPTIDATAGLDSSVYFIRFQSLSATDSNNEPLEAFSAKFTLTSMTGTFSSEIQSQIAGVTTAGGNQVFTETGGAAATASEVVATITVTQSSATSTSTGSHDSAAAPSARAVGGLAAFVTTLLALILA